MAMEMKRSQFVVQAPRSKSRLPRCIRGCWCAKAGLQHAIVYSGQGQVKKVYGVIRSLCKDQVRLQTQDGKLEGCHDLTVSLLSEEESLSPLLSAATRPVANTHGLEHVDDLHQTAAWLDKKLQQAGSSSAAMIEPDLMLIFGKAFTIGGYPPWPIRVTEMYHMGRLKWVSTARLQAALQQYCSTLQRFGT
ncbi:hypothetical protein ABBQ38_008366 [Trebouxia sp. C0009 RCD-2024]